MFGVLAPSEQIVVNQSHGVNEVGGVSVGLIGTGSSANWKRDIEQPKPMMDVGNGSRRQDAGVRMAMLFVVVVMRAGVMGVTMVVAAWLVMIMSDVATRVRMPKPRRHDTAKQHRGRKQ